MVVAKKGSPWSIVLHLASGTFLVFSLLFHCVLGGQLVCYDTHAWFISSAYHLVVQLFYCQHLSRDLVGSQSGVSLPWMPTRFCVGVVDQLGDVWVNPPSWHLWCLGMLPVEWGRVVYLRFHIHHHWVRIGHQLGCCSFWGYGWFWSCSLVVSHASRLSFLLVCKVISSM